MNAQKADQAITVTTHAPASAVFNSSFTSRRRRGSGGAVSFSSAGACSNTGATFTITSGSGTCTVKYDQAGNGNYNAAPQVTESVTAQKANQTIIVTLHAPACAVFNTGFSVAANGGGSGNPVTFSSSGVCSNSGGKFTMTSGTGTCTVKFDQAGNGDYNAAPQVVETVTAQKASQTITFAPLPDKTYGDPDFTVSATADSGLAVELRRDRRLHRQRIDRPPDRRRLVHDHRLAGGQRRTTTPRSTSRAPSRSTRRPRRWPS